MIRTFLNKVAELDKLTQEVRECATCVILGALHTRKRIDLTDNQINIYYQGDYVQVYEVYLSPNNSLMLDVEEFGSILLVNLSTDDLKNIALEVHELMITD